MCGIAPRDSDGIQVVPGDAIKAYFGQFSPAPRPKGAGLRMLHGQVLAGRVTAVQLSGRCSPCVLDSVPRRDRYLVPRHPCRLPCDAAWRRPRYASLAKYALGTSIHHLAFRTLFTRQPWNPAFPSHVVRKIITASSSSLASGKRSPPMVKRRFRQHFSHRLPEYTPPATR
jgi:hypothetical protein